MDHNWAISKLDRMSHPTQRTRRPRRSNSLTLDKCTYKYLIKLVFGPTLFGTWSRILVPQGIFILSNEGLLFFQ